MRPLYALILILVLYSFGCEAVCAQSDLGVPLGSMLPHLVGTERELFRAGRDAFTRIISVQGDSYFRDTEVGLGPLFNGNSCAMCHAYPAIGGSSPVRNSQIDVARLNGAKNKIPIFLHPDGPALQARFRIDAHGRSDGAVHPLFSIAGRTDAQGCDVPQTDFDSEYRRGNVSFRIPAPLFGAGLIEAISDSEILLNANKNLDEKQRLGIHGHPNRTTADGAIGRFGWKAETVSLEAFTAEAYAIEQGVTNELFPQERSSSAGACRFNPTPEDRFSPFARRPIDSMSNVSKVAYFLRFLAPPQEAEEIQETAAGRELFSRVGCNECHTPRLVSGNSSSPALSEQPVNLYSDLLIHHMGGELADGVQQGMAAPDEFRTAPLWGLGKRLFFLHDGRTRDLDSAILMHTGRPYSSRASEAQTVIAHYKELNPEDKNALITFLKTL